MKAVNVFGKKSVSELMNVILRIVWVLVWAIPVYFMIWFLLVWITNGYDDGVKYLVDHFSYKFGNIEGIFWLWIKWCMAMLTIWGLKKLFTNLLDEKIFIPANTTAIRVIALAKLINSTYISFSYEGIFFALVIFILAEIFKVGDNLKQDVESIV